MEKMYDSSNMSRLKLLDVNLQNKKLVEILKKHELDLEETRQINQKIENNFKNLIETRFWNMFNFHSAKMLLINPKTGKIIDANKSATEFYGYELSALRSMYIHDINQLKQEQIREECARALKNDCNCFIFPHKLSNGEIRTVEVHSTPIEHEGEQILFSIIHDITEREKAEKNLLEAKDRLEKNEELYRSTFEYAAVGIAHVDLNGNLTKVNDKFCKTTGYTKEELYKMNISVLTHPEDLIIEHEYINQVLSNKIDAFTIEKRYIHKDGHIIWIILFSNVIRDKNKQIRFAVATISDITEQRTLKDEIIKSKEKAEESDKLKTAFINNISHEIRTPLNGILGFGQVLSESELPIRQREKMFTKLQQSSTRLLNTVSDYMNMARIVTGEMEVHKKEFILQPLFEEITKDAKQLCLGNDIAFKAEIPEKYHDLSIYSDPELIKIILAKLLDNACKFTCNGSITCGYYLKSDDIAFFVSDTGNGIESSKLDVIFQMFMQGDISMTRGYEGSGLGLTIAKGLITLLGGDMTVASEKDKGSTFTFIIPINHAGNFGTTELSRSAEIRHDVQPLILIAEDDELNYEYLAIVLDSIGYRHIHVVDGAAAVDMCKQNPDISVVLMDIKMPVMNGVEATNLIRKFRPGLPIIAITAYAQLGDEHRFLAAGCNDYLAKPIKASDLSAMIRKYSEAVVADKP